MLSWFRHGAGHISDERKTLHRKSEREHKQLEDAPGQNRYHVLTKITQDSSQVLLVMTSCREKIFSPRSNPRSRI